MDQLKGINQPVNINTTPAAPRTKILKSGAIYDLDKGRIVGKAGENPYAITKENTHEFKRKRQEKTAALLRARLVETYNAVMPLPARGSAEVFAGAGAMLFEQIVLNSEAYPRDRMEAWDKIGKAAGVLADPRGVGEESAPLQQAAEFTSALTGLVSALKDALSSKAEAQIRATDSEVIESDAG